MPLSSTKFPLSDADLVAYSDAVGAAFAQAGTAENAYYEVGGGIVCISAPDSQLLEKLTRALAHLRRSTPARPDFTINVWAGDPAPPSPLLWYRQHGGERAAADLLEPRLDAHGQLPVFSSPQIMAAFKLGPKTLRLIDWQMGRAYSWISRSSEIRYYVESAPFHELLGWWFSRNNKAVVHAAAVGNPDGGVLFIGDSGAGKSSSAVACLRSPLLYAGDDYCLVAADAEPRVYSLYNSAKFVGPEDLRRFSHLEPFVRNKERLDGEKALVFIQDALPEKIGRQFPLRALIMPRITGTARARLLSASAAAALQAVAPTTIAQQPASARAALPLLVRLVRQVPSYILEIGPDVQQIPEQVQQLLAAGRAP